MSEPQHESQAGEGDIVAGMDIETIMRFIMDMQAKYEAAVLTGTVEKLVGNAHKRE
jgi:hypothetical protein